ncbi:MAG: hypothetical protein V3U49_00405 [Nitrososphaerales archaeon]
MTKKIDIVDVKRWGGHNLHASSTLRKIILMEPDELSTPDFIAQIPRWLKLAEVD